MTDNELRLKRSIEYIIEDIRGDKAERIMDLTGIKINEICDNCVITYDPDTHAYVDADAVKKRLGL